MRSTAYAAFPWSPPSFHWACCFQRPPGPIRVTFPENFKDFVMYAKYDRGSSWDEAFALPETIALSKAGQPLPGRHPPRPGHL